MYCSHEFRALGIKILNVAETMSSGICILFLCWGWRIWLHKANKCATFFTHSSQTSVSLHFRRENVFHKDFALILYAMNRKKQNQNIPFEPWKLCTTYRLKSFLGNAKLKFQRIHSFRLHCLFKSCFILEKSLLIQCIFLNF